MELLGDAGFIVDIHMKASGLSSGCSGLGLTLIYWPRALTTVKKKERKSHSCEFATQYTCGTHTLQLFVCKIREVTRRGGCVLVRPLSLPRGRFYCRAIPAKTPCLPTGHRPVARTTKLLWICRLPKAPRPRRGLAGSDTTQVPHPSATTHQSLPV